MINSLSGVEDIDGKPICVMDKLRNEHPEKFNSSGSMDYKWFESEIRPNFNIFLRHDVDSIAFNMMTKPASEGGNANRCQWSDLVLTGLKMLEHLNDKYPCDENDMAIWHIMSALHYNTQRTVDRVDREVEGSYEL